MAARYQIAVGSVVRVHYVLAGAYRGDRLDHSEGLTHAYIEGEEFAICKRAPSSHAHDLTYADAPTCPTCNKRLGAYPLTNDFPDRSFPLPAPSRSQSRPPVQTEMIAARIAEGGEVSGRELLEVADFLDLDLSKPTRRLLDKNQVRKITPRMVWYTGRVPEDLAGLYGRAAEIIRAGEAGRDYYLWVVPMRSDVPHSQADSGPYTCAGKAGDVARALAADSDRFDYAVSFGADPEHRDFKIMSRYEAHTGRKIA